MPFLKIFHAWRVLLEPQLDQMAVTAIELGADE